MWPLLSLMYKAGKGIASLTWRANDDDVTKSWFVIETKDLGFYPPSLLLWYGPHPILLGRFIDFINSI